MQEVEWGPRERDPESCGGVLHVLFSDIQVKRKVQICREPASPVVGLVLQTYLS